MRGARPHPIGVSAAPAIPGWIVLGVAALFAIVLYAPILPAMVAEWAEFPSLSHGFAIPVIAAYLVVSRRHRLRGVTLEPALRGLPILVLGLTMLVVGVRGDETFLARISLPITVLGLTIVLAGMEATRHVWPGIVYLAFMIPLPWTTVKVVAYQDQLLVAAASATALPWLGVPVYRDGVLLHLANATLEVADTCSSVPALAALLSLGIAYASLAERPPAIRTLLIVATVPLAVVSNIVRVTITAAGVYLVGPWTLATPFHVFTGTVNFLLTFGLLLMLDVSFTRMARPTTSWGASKGPPSPPGARTRPGKPGARLEHAPGAIRSERPGEPGARLDHRIRSRAQRP
ncbi:MAG: exosortase/archaeosortase family protein [Candidatus Rokubacteria bacterium]|nr:exosortase/archaeosortase family protein [Candidatus Rokubacteria bacterium]